jgi:large subunit ribosomal protein L14e
METSPSIGQIVKILRGKDRDGYAIVIGIVDDRFVLIADGDKRRFDEPKKKNLLHLEFSQTVSTEVSDSMRETGRVTNAKLRFALQKYIERKGE